jgi:hypothetical protein
LALLRHSNEIANARQAQTDAHDAPPIILKFRIVYSIFLFDRFIQRWFAAH